MSELLTEINLDEYAETEEALKITGYKNVRSLQRLVEKKRLTVVKAKLKEFNFVEKNFYPRKQLEGFAASKEQIRVVNDNPQTALAVAAPPAIAPETIELLQKIISPLTDALNSFQHTAQLAAAPAEEKPLFYTVKEASDATGLSEAAIKEMINAGTLKRHKGKHGKVLVSRKEIEKL